MSKVADPQRYERMPYARCGRSGLQLPRLSLGLWHNFGDVDDFENARKLVGRAFDLGITHFDLANNYGPPPGSAETNFGKIWQADLAAYRDELVISTKAGYLMWPGPYGEWGSRKSLLGSLDQSLRRMKLDYVDIFYSHRFDPDTPLEETMGALAHAVKSGKALYAGVSSYSPEQTRQAAAILAKLGTPALIHQPVYNLMNRWVEDGLLQTLQEEGMGCIAFCPLAQGLLTDRYLKGIPPDSRAAREHFLKPEHVEKAVGQVRSLAKVAERRGQTLAQMALVWVLRQSAVTSALIGASKISQLEENVKALEKLEFTPEELTEINSIIA
jgi:L-glyceraldehyde 3-phosphate reductase